MTYEDLAFFLKHYEGSILLEEFDISFGYSGELYANFSFKNRII